jgi:hypothetical protein
MALQRFRPVQYRTHFAVLDHGAPVRDETVTIAAGAGAGESVPLFAQDGDPDDPDTSCVIVWRSGSATAEDCAAAVAEATRRNREDDPSRPDLLTEA